MTFFFSCSNADNTNANQIDNELNAEENLSYIDLTNYSLEIKVILSQFLNYSNMDVNSKTSERITIKKDDLQKFVLNEITIKKSIFKGKGVRDMVRIFNYDTLFRDIQKLGISYGPSLKVSYDIGTMKEWRSRKIDSLKIDFSKFDLLKKIEIKLKPEAKNFYRTAAGPMCLKCKSDTTFEEFIKTGSYSGQDYGDFKKHRINYNCNYSNIDLNLPENLTEISINGLAYSNVNFKSENQDNLNLKKITLSTNSLDYFCGFGTYQVMGEDGFYEEEPKYDYSNNVFQKSILDNYSFKVIFNFNNIALDSLKTISFNPLTASIIGINSANKINFEFDEMSYSHYERNIRPKITSRFFKRGLNFSDNSANSSENIANTKSDYYRVEDPDGWSNLRKTAGGEIIKRVYESEEFQVIGKVNNYKKIKLNDGTVGFIHKSRVVPIDNRFTNDKSVSNKNSEITSIDNLEDLSNNTSLYFSDFEILCKELNSNFSKLFLDVHDELLTFKENEDLAEESRNKQNSSACECMKALSGVDYGEEYDNMKLTCIGIYKCWDNAQKDCLSGQSNTWTKCY